jgi:hypothetical protein
MPYDAKQETETKTWYPTRGGYTFSNTTYDKWKGLHVRWHNVGFSHCVLNKCYWEGGMMDQACFGNKTVLDGCVFNGVDFNRLNFFSQIHMLGTTWKDCTASFLRFESSTISENRWVNCKFDRVDSLNTRWFNCRFDGNNKIQQLTVDSKSRMDYQCYLHGLTITNLIDTPLRKQIRLVHLGAQVNSGLHPIAAWFQRARNYMRGY